LVSPDVDFSPTGAKSGIKYTESFLTYKDMLIENSDSSVFKRIFSEINASVFGSAPPISRERVAEDGGYEYEIEQFKAEVFADSPDKTISDDDLFTLTLPPDDPSPQPIAKSPIRTALELPAQPIPEFPIPPAPESPAMPEPHISISVTSHVSTNSVGASQVSNIVNSNVVLPQAELENTPPPPSQKVMARPAPRRKVAKPKKTPVPSDPGTADTTPAPSNVTKGKTAADPPTRTLRKRG
jgi:hypothetical protein